MGWEEPHWWILSSFLAVDDGKLQASLGLSSAHRDTCNLLLYKIVIVTKRALKIVLESQ